MGSVAVRMKIVVEDVEQIEEIKEKIKNIESIADVSEEEVGFGIKVIRAVAVIPDSGGQLEVLENSIKGIEGVEQVDITSIDLV